MKEKLKNLKKANGELRDITSYLYRTTVSDDKTNLIKFRNFIHSNEIVKEIILPYIDDSVDISKFAYFGQFHIVFDKPVEDDLLYKYIIKFIDEAIDDKRTLHEIFVYYKRKRSLDDSIQEGLKDLVDPLFRFISRELISQIEEIENELSNKAQEVILGDVAKDGGVIKKAGRDYSEANNSPTTKTTSGDIFQGDKNSKKVHFYQKEGFVSGIISGIIVGLAVWGIEELIKFLIEVL